MQVSYKTVTSLEFDIYTGTYKQVEKQVEDTSGGFTENAFYELLMGLNGSDSSANAYEMGDESAFKLNEGLGAKSVSLESNEQLLARNSQDNPSESLYALRFRQSDEPLSTAVAGGGVDAEQLKGSLMSKLLMALD